MSANVPFHTRLNQRLWMGHNNLRPEVRVRLLRTAITFYRFLDAPGLVVSDLVLTGSNCAYNYTAQSDVDLHLVVDYSRTECPDFVAGFFDAKRLLWNQTHQVSIRGHAVELYVEDTAQPAHSGGVYSVLRGMWRHIPRAIRPRVDDTALIRKIDGLRSEAKSVLDRAASIDEIEKVLDRLRRMRTSGLMDGGEFSIENLAYKRIRSEGLLDLLYTTKLKMQDRSLSIPAK
jgi:hypothetical protein